MTVGEVTTRSPSVQPGEAGGCQAFTREELTAMLQKATEESLRGPNSHNAPQGTYHKKEHARGQFLAVVSGIVLVAFSVLYNK